MCAEQWFEMYRAAILETDRDKLEIRINEVEDAIRERVASLVEISPDERVSLEDARTGIQVLKQEYRNSLGRS